MDLLETLVCDEGKIVRRPAVPPRPRVAQPGG